MQELLDDIIPYIRGVWHKRRFILIFGWLICPLGWALVTMLPNHYTAEARVYADTRSILQPLLRGLAIQSDPTKELQLMVKTLLSRTNLEVIARDIDADVKAKTAKEYDAIISDLEDNIKIKSNGRNLYTISYTGREPIYVKDVVQAALNVFVENTLGEQRLDTDKANEIISSQIGDYEVRLIEAETNLADFKRDNRGYLPGSDSGYYSQLEMVKAQHEDAQLALSESESRVSTARGQLQREEALAAEQLSRVKTEYDSRIEALQQRLDEQVFRFTDKHPDVIETRRQLEELQALKKKSVESYSTDEALVDNALYQDLKISISQLENEAASLRVRVKRYRAKRKELEAKLDKVPKVEAGLTALTRNYKITKEKYEQLLSRKESALISQSVGDSSDDIKFRIIDAPRVPQKPSGPMRPLLLSAVLVMGVGTGVAVSFVLSQISPVVASTKQLYQLTNFPVFGTVSVTEVSGLALLRKRRTRLFILFNFLLVVLFAACLAVNVVPSVQQSLLQGIDVTRVVNLLQGMKVF